MAKSNRLDQLKGSSPLKRQAAGDNPSLHDLTNAMVPAFNRDELESQAVSIMQTGKGEVRLYGATLNAAGLEVPDNMPEEDMMEIFRFLLSMHRIVGVAIGDLLNHVSLEHGDIQMIAQELGYDRETLYAWRRITERVQIPLRKGIYEQHPDGKVLGISHYQLVEKMEKDEQWYWLEKAITERLSVAELRQQIKGKPATVVTRNAYDVWVSSGLAVLVKDYSVMKPHERKAIAQQIYDVIKDDL